MSNNYRLKDDELKNAGKQISEELEKSQRLLNRYLILLENICARGFIQGETNKALIRFHDELKSVFNNKLIEVGADVNTLCKSLVQEADRLDEDLYN